MGEIIENIYEKKIYDKKTLIKDINPIKIIVEDIPQIIEISYSFWGKRGLYKRTILEKIINQKLSYAYKIKDELIAFCLMYNKINTNIINVYLICVKKEYQGNNLGKSLLSYCINYCKYCNFKNFDLHVSTNNIVAFTVYKKLGFIVKSFLKNYYRDENPENNDAFYMTLNIC